MISNNMQAAQQNLETINSRITLAESELNRLNKLVASENYTVSELVKQKKFEEDEIIRLRDEVDKLDKIKKAMSSNILDAENKISQAKTIEKEANAKLFAADKRSCDVFNQETSSNEKLKEYESILSKKEAELDATAKKVLSKAKIILDFTKSVAEISSKLESER